MTDFKPGDKVRRINDQGQPSDFPHKVAAGQVYTISEVTVLGSLRFVETGQFGFAHSRFERIASEAPSLIEQALAQAKAEPAKKGYEPETFVGKPIDWSKLIKDAST